jgi:sugar/nucleoside kinase (ribokinase family)
MRSYDVLVAGYTCVDVIPNFKSRMSFTDISKLLAPGKLIEIDGLHFVLGGLVPNVGLAMKKFAKKVFLNGLVGDDAIGTIAKQLLGKCGISEGIKTIESAETASSIVIAPPGCDRIFLESPGCNRIFDSSHLHFDVVSQCRLYHFGYPPLLRQFFLNGGRELVRMFANVQQMGVTTSLDFSLLDPESESGRINWLEIFQRTLPFTDIFVPSLQEVLQIMMPGKCAGMQAPPDNISAFNETTVNLIREIGGRIIGCGVKILLIKAGTSGAFLLTGDTSSIGDKLGLNLRREDWNYQAIWCGAYPVDRSKVLNASGAGDTAAAAFLSAILDGESPELALKYAAVAGRNKLYCHSPYHDLSNWETMTEEIKSEPNEIIHF